MMNIRTFFCFLAVVVLFAGCKNDDSSTLTADLTVQYEARYGSDHLIKYHNYDFTGFPIQFNRFDLFVSEVTLFNNAGSVTLTPVEFLNFTPDNAHTDSTPTIKAVYSAIPEGNYTGVRIGYGVKPEFNNKTPNDYPLTNPLSNGGEYWSGWKSYIFSKIEGQADTDKNGIFDTFLTYHCGSNAVYRYETINVPIQVTRGSTMKIAFDLQKVLTTATGQPYNIVADPVTSNDKDSVRVAAVLMGNFGKATSVSQ
jgi:hypothetical protein